MFFQLQQEDLSQIDSAASLRVHHSFAANMHQFCLTISTPELIFAEPQNAHLVQGSGLLTFPIQATLQPK